MRNIKIKRTTKETDITCELNLDVLDNIISLLG